MPEINRMIPAASRRMSAPHVDGTDRLCVVVSGTWWVTSGDIFDPGSTVPVSAGSFVHRVARTSPCDGVKPITFHPVDPSQPDVRKV